MTPLEPGEVRCPRCLRATCGWPLHRQDLYSPGYYAHCLRQPWVILEKMTDKDRRKIMRALGVTWNMVPYPNGTPRLPVYPSKMEPWQVAEADNLYDEMSVKMSDTLPSVTRTKCHIECP